MKDNELQFDRSCHVLYSKPCKKAILAKIALHYPAAEREAVQRLDGLTPGDFATVLKRLCALKVQPSAASLRAGLAGEVKLKRHGKEAIGFL